MTPPSGRIVALLGTLAGVVLGSGLGFVAGRGSALAPSAPSAALAASSLVATPISVHSFPQTSFAQQGEDLIIDNMVDQLHLKAPTYLDIGAHDPVRNNNTFLFYALGSRGVLVEPNPELSEKLRGVRPRDTVLPVGIGVTDEAAADYYMMKGDGELNTFSKAEADEMARTYGSKVVERVIKVPLVNVNEVMEQHFPGKGPDILSIDTEGFDLDILKSIDFSKFRPRIICAETFVGGTRHVEGAIIAFVTAQRYTVRGATFVNTIFVADELIDPPSKPAASATPAASASSKPAK
jgi:FkbM family methyltransferase